MVATACFDPPDEMSGEALKAYALTCGEDMAVDYVTQQTGINPREIVREGKVDWIAVGVLVVEYETGIDLDPHLFNPDGSLNWRSLVKNAGAIGASAFCTAYGAGAVAPVCSWAGGIIAGVLYDELGRPIYDVASGMAEGIADAASSVGDLIGIGPDDPEPLRASDFVFLRPSLTGDLDAVVSWYAAYEKDMCRNIVALRFLSIVAAEAIETLRYLWEQRTGFKTTWAQMHDRFVANGLAMPSGWGNCLGPWVGQGSIFHRNTPLRKAWPNQNTTDRQLLIDEIAVALDVFQDKHRTAFDISDEATLSTTTIFEFSKLSYPFWSQEGILDSELYVPVDDRPVRTFFLSGSLALKNRIPLDHPALVAYIIDTSLPSRNPSLNSDAAKIARPNFYPLNNTARDVDYSLAAWPDGHYWDSKPFYPYSADTAGTIRPFTGSNRDTYVKEYFTFVDKADVAYIPAIRHFARDLSIEKQAEQRAHAMRSIAMATAACRKDLRLLLRGGLTSPTLQKGSSTSSSLWKWGATALAGYAGYRVATKQPLVPTTVRKRLPKGWR